MRFPSEQKTCSPSPPRANPSWLLPLASWVVVLGVCIFTSPIQAQQQGLNQNKSVSPRGVARIHEKDFPQRPVERPQIQAGSVHANSAARVKLLPSTTAHIPSNQAQQPENAPDQGALADTIDSAILPSSNETLPTAKADAVATTEVESQASDLGSTLAAENEVIAEPDPNENKNEKSPKQEDSQKSVWSFDKLKDRKTLPSTIQMIISVAAISLVPAILLMTTCFIRIVVVLGILRQAIGLQQLPPTQVTTALALMMTFLIMAPTWQQVKNEAVDPYTAEGSTMSWDEAWNKGVTPVKKFMWSQIRRAENEDDFWVFYDYLPEEERLHEPTSFNEIPLKALLPAFMISELKVAFLIGIQILLPFLILDIVVASLCNTMGLIMLPPSVVSLPLKLLLFVMVDGWNLVVAMLLNSFALVQ